MKKSLLAILFSSIGLASIAQYKSTLSASEWVDSVFNSLSKDEKIAQLIVIRAHSNLGPDHVEQVTNLITKYNVGALCFFQGGPVRQANLTNQYQAIAKTPLMITIDGEYGLGMRLDSVARFPYQATLGALTDTAIIYQMGRAVGRQMKRIGVHVNYAPTVDVNNNPANPVIGFRSFGEDKNKVARFGVAYMRGMQDEGIMACAKHFPGHGDTEVDSHLDLPVINKSMAQLDSLELYPFKELIKAGVGSVMNAHLFIPAIDKSPNRPTSLSKKSVTDLLRKKLNFTGLSVTDALEMKGVTKFFPAGDAAVQALRAGNDMLCLPDNVEFAMAAIKKAIAKKRLSWKDIDKKVKKVLYAKYNLGLYQKQWIDTTNLVRDVNAEINGIRSLVARNTVTVMRDSQNLLPLTKGRKLAYIGFGLTAPNEFSRRMQQEHNADIYLVSYKEGDDRADYILQQVKEKNYDEIIAGVHNYNLRPANNFGLSASALQLWNNLPQAKTATLLFGNVYAAGNFCQAPTLAAFHQDDSITHEAAADFMSNELSAKGKLPVSVCDLPFGKGLTMINYYPGPTSTAWIKIDSLVSNAILQGAFPGAVVLVAKDGEIKYHKAFGNYEYDVSRSVNLETIFDLASVTKISATTIAVMKLYEQGKLDLKKTIGDYLPWTVGTNKARLHIDDILLHQAGLTPFIPFYRETIDSAGHPLMGSIYSSVPKEGYTIPVAQNLYLRNDWQDTLFKRILASPLSAPNRYVYSDNDFIFLGKIVEAISGVPLDEYVSQNFYQPMGMSSTGFKPLYKFNGNQIIPTEVERNFREQLIHGYVHDEGASLFGGVAGHAGLFSNAYDLLKLCQMLLNGGEFNGTRYLKPETIRMFTSYQSKHSRRGYGFDKPEKDNATRSNPYPSASASPETFGHTGFTGTCVWIDPKYKLVYIFLSNRVYPTRENNKLSKMDVRTNIQEAIYEAIRKEDKQQNIILAQGK
ncbi:serine hydrolase [Chitinophagaceae bacterium LB-8]|uniref:beta-N-acetylhexosaminidase n=1 Tax=Paraflavisolibacter caeni TaxID=2982496 RepID=A0A9X3B968_9BACT|nr:glycoside hydrolase family 3 N-terminal domain-containing protein [Paraflavisolibacter caeni]MCU7550731.1 serine hydrolase [Paraflavisolibacter caeni]